MTAVLAPRRVSTSSGSDRKPRTRFTEGDIAKLQVMLLDVIPKDMRWRTMRGDVVRRLTNRQPLPLGCLVFVHWQNPPQEEEHKRFLVHGYREFLEDRGR